MIRFSGLLATLQTANHPRRRDPNTSPDLSIGRSDGRCAGGTTRPVKARSVSPTEETSRPVLTEGGPGDPSQDRYATQAPDQFNKHNYASEETKKDSWSVVGCASTEPTNTSYPITTHTPHVHCPANINLSNHSREGQNGPPEKSPENSPEKSPEKSPETVPAIGPQPKHHRAAPSTRTLPTPIRTPTLMVGTEETVHQYTYQHVGPSRGLSEGDFRLRGLSVGDFRLRGPSMGDFRPRGLSVSTHISTLTIPVECPGDFCPRGQYISTHISTLALLVDYPWVIFAHEDCPWVIFAHEDCPWVIFAHEDCPSVRISARWPFPWTVRVIFAHDDSTSVHISARWPFPWTVRVIFAHEDCPSVENCSFAPIPKSDERFARQYRCGPPPVFPLASPRSGIVHHLLGPDRHAHTRTLLRRSRSVGCAPVRDPANQLPYALRVYSPVDSHTCQTPWSVFQDGSNGEPTGRRPEHADAEARREAHSADHD
ncbi:hypothetical protein Bca4012_076515 [Brassica carinata]